MTFRADIQTLEPGSLVQLIEVDCTAFGGDLLLFHGHAIVHSAAEVTEDPCTLLLDFAGQQYATQAIADVGTAPAKSIWWQGQEYKAWPCQIEGMEANSSGSPAAPTLSVGNIDGSISAACLFFDDFLQAKVTVRQTLTRYLDARNYPQGNPEADPTQEAIEIWYIDRKTVETGELVQWELSSPGDVSGQMIPARIITGLCEWCLRGAYRGPECGYTGAARFTEDDEPTDNPELDRCGGLVRSCKLRFGEREELPFGGFPGAALLRTS